MRGAGSSFSACAADPREGAGATRGVEHIGGWGILKTQDTFDYNFTVFLTDSHSGSSLPPFLSLHSLTPFLQDPLAPFSFLSSLSLSLSVSLSYFLRQSASLLFAALYLQLPRRFSLRWPGDTMSVPFSFRWRG